MTVVDFKPEHLQKIHVKDIHAGEVPNTVMTYAKTIMDEDHPVAIIGGFRFTPSVIHLWALVSDDVRKRPIAFHKLVKNLLAYLCKQHHLKRIQMDVKADYLEGQKWAESLGFKQEGLMRGFGVHGEDFYLYGRVG